MAVRAFSRRLLTVGFARRAMLAFLVVALFLGGVQLRRWTWEKTRHARIQRDIANGFYWGNETLAEARRLSPDGTSANSWTAFFRGYFALYDRVKREAYQNDYGLDYPPLRLLVMSIWAKHVREKFPRVDDRYLDHVEPLLNANLLCELVSAVAIFLLVRLWVRRTSRQTTSSFLRRLPPEHRDWICGLAAASVAWFEPSMILDAHGWPQWDVWIVPFYVLAALAASRNRWFCCGCLLATGAMFKGQLLLVAPFFFLWPLWQKKWKRALRVLAGFAATVALLVSPWLLRNLVAWIAVAGGGAFSSLLVLRSRLHHPGVLIGGIIALTVFIVGALSGGSFAWLQLGFLYGSEHHPYLFISSGYNLPSLLAGLGWSLKDPFWSGDIGSLHFAFTPQWTLRLLYLGAVALCALGAARHILYRNPRLLIAFATPWLLMFGLLGQMHERYLMWGAVVSAVALGVSVRLSLPHFVISAASTAMIAYAMLIDLKLGVILRAINVRHAARVFPPCLVLASVAIYFWVVVFHRVPITRRSTCGGLKKV